MRLALVTKTSPGLSETFIAGKFLGLLKRGWDIHILCTESMVQQIGVLAGLDSMKDLGLRLHVEQVPGVFGKGGLSTPCSFLRTLLTNPQGLVSDLLVRGPAGSMSPWSRVFLNSRLVELKPDLIHFEDSTSSEDVNRMCHAIDCPVVASYRDNSQWDGFPNSKAQVNAWWEGVSSVHFASEAQVRRGVESGFARTSSHVVISPGVDLGFFAPLKSEIPRDKQRFRVLSVGRMTWEKGYEHALAAIHRLGEIGVQVEYRVIGDGPLMEGLCFQKRRLGLDSTVKFLGAVEPARIRDEMGWADVFLDASVFGDTSNSLKEAQAMELPVVGSDIPAFGEVVEGGVTGLLVVRRDVEALAGALERIALNPGLRVSLGKAGRRRVASLFDMESRVLEFEQWYKRVAWESRDGSRSLVSPKSGD